MKKLLLLILLLIVAAGCTIKTPFSPAAPTVEPSPTPLPADYPWWTDSIGYEIFVRSFYDSNGDGIGDFNGITHKLDYLNDGDPNTNTDLGITTIWLMPIFPSPSYHGYDVTDYYSVNPQYGTMDDFKTLLAEAHKRGIKVVIDMVLNHTSDQHPWFKDAKGSPTSKHRDWYIWSETDPGYKGPWGEDVWHPSLTGYYYGIFESFMPDLNYNNPEVTKQMEDVTRFWLQDVGVDGFRLDAAKHLIENKRLQENSSATHDWFRQYRDFYKKINPRAITIGELFGNNLSVVKSYTQGDQFDLAFNFDLASAFVQSAKTGSAFPALGAINSTNRVLESRMYAPFLTNHDQNRTMTELEGNRKKAKVAATLLLTSPGMPFIYYGEEIGMEGMKPDENIRRPMQWNAETNSGFTTGSPWRQPDSKYKFINVDMESGDSTSLLAHYRSLIHLRNQHTALRTGDLTIVKSKNSSVYAIMRSSPDDAVLVLVNTSDQSVSSFALSLDGSQLAEGAYKLTPLMGTSTLSEVNVGPGGSVETFKPVEALQPYETIILALNK